MSSIVIKAGPNDTNDSVIRKFQKRVALDNAVLEYRDRQFHVTNSEKRQLKRAERQRKIMRHNRGLRQA